MHLRWVELQATSFRSKNDHHGEKNSKEVSQHLINEVFPYGEICAQLSARDTGNAKNEAWDQHLFQG